MADVFDAFFGVGSGLNEDSQPMINALRGQKRDGDFAALSTIGQISADGRAQSNQALAAGEKAGGLKLAREAEQRKKEEEEAQAKRDHAMKMSQIGREHALAMAMEKQRQANTIAGKQFDVDNREGKPITYKDMKEYKDAQGNRFQLMQGSDGYLYRQSGIADAPLQKVSGQGLTEVPSSTGSQEATKAYKTYYRKNANGVLEHQDAMQRTDGTVVTMDGKPLTSEWSLFNPDKGAASVKLKPNPVRVLDANGNEIKARQGMYNGKLYNVDTGEEIDTSAGGYEILPDYKKYNDATATKIKEKVNLAAQALAVFDSVKPEYANDTGVPFWGTLENMTSKYLGKQASDEINAQGAWWKKLRRFNDLLVKKDFFGTAQSVQEIKSWVSANIDENATDVQLMQYADMMRGALTAEINADMEADKGFGYDPKVVDATRAAFTNKVFHDPIGGQSDLKMPEGQGWDEEEWLLLSNEDKKLVIDDLRNQQGQ